MFPYFMGRHKSAGYVIIHAAAVHNAPFSRILGAIQ
jgi:hypothetical protein